MFTHEQIWRGIDRLAAFAETSPSGLARRAGLDSTTFNPSKRFSADGRKPRWPSTESIAKALSAANVGLGDFARFVRGDAAEAGLPVLDLADAAPQSAFSASGEPAGGAWNRLGFPDLAPGEAFALRVDTDSMAPVFRAGTELIVSRQERPRAGDRVMVKMRDGTLEGWELGPATVQSLKLIPFDPDRPHRTVALTKVEWIARIVWASQ